MYSAIALYCNVGDPNDRTGLTLKCGVFNVHVVCVPVCVRRSYADGKSPTEVMLRSRPLHYSARPTFLGCVCRLKRRGGKGEKLLYGSSSRRRKAQ